ncbi:MAG: hypothetical protein RLZZ519_2305, partial [Bacteroidota bacterium]
NNGTPPEGYVSLGIDHLPNLVPTLVLWGLMLNVCEELKSICGAGCFEAPTTWALDSLLVEIHQRIEKDSYQGELSFRRIPWVSETGKSFASHCHLESYPAWLPYISNINLYELISHHGSQLIYARSFEPRVTARVPVPQSIQAQFVEDLKLGRIWGKPVPSIVYNMDLNPTTNTTITIRSYHALLGYYELRKNQHSQLALEDLPFSVDWFHNIGSKIPKDFQIYPFMQFLEEEWRNSPYLAQGSRWVDYEHWEIELFFGYIDIERLGYIRIINIFEIDDSLPTDQS